MILSAQDVRQTIQANKLSAWTLAFAKNVLHSLENLEKSLCCQSVRLAQALKEKNDALERLTSSMEETRQIAATTVRQAQEIKQRNAILASRDKEIERYTVQRDALNARVEQLSSELAALRPPEPKFKVGQILVRLDRGAEGHAFSVRHVSQAYGGNWLYTNCKDRAVNGWINEYDLRAQTAQEKGE